MMNGEEKSNQTSSEIHASLTIANAEIVECLMELKNKKTEIVEVGSIETWVQINISFTCL